MGKAQSHNIPKEARIRRLSEVSLGFNKKIAQDEARRCPQCAVATCLPACPLGIDIPGFIRLLREGDINPALERIRKENPFAAICGRICPAPCEASCVFKADGQPISIRELERFAADTGQRKLEKVNSNGKKVAVIGSGPAGMAAAYYLAKANLQVTVFEAASEPGGMLRFGVPEFRLPQEVLDEQFAQLKSLGVEIQTDVIVGRTLKFEELLMQGFAAVLFATGASLPRFSSIAGNGLAGVFYDVEFLNRLQLRAKESALHEGQEQFLVGPKTVVIGRGIAAFDCARLALRLGSSVQIVFECFEEESGVSREMLQVAHEEGIESHSMQVLEILGEDDFVQGVKCRKLEIVEDKDGLKLQALNEDPVILEAQTVIIANGHQAKEEFNINLPHVFACGDLINATGSVVESLASGKNIARQIIQFLEKS